MSPAGDVTARPLERFFRLEASSGLVLLAAAGVALLWANSPWGASYAQFWQAPIALRLGGYSLDRNLEWLVNQGLMAVFFFLVGLEIRRELRHGELSDARRAALPIAAALGGAVVPTILFMMIAGQARLRAGWGAPLTTDLAFALGVLTLLGRRVPASLRMLVLAVSVFSELCAVLVITLFYSPGLGLGGLLLATSGVASIFMLQRLGVRAKAAYLVPGLVVWAGVSMAGVHPGMAGVLLGLLTPVDASLGPRGFVWRMQRELKILERSGPDEENNPQLALSLREVGQTRREAMSPADALIELLHPLVAFAILPVFALANAGVSLRGLTFDAPAQHLAWAVALALVLGKPLGVLIACGLTLYLSPASLPKGLRPRQLAVLAALSGVGFTFAIVIGELAFDSRLLAATKVGVLIGSAAAALLALGLGRWLLPSWRAPAMATRMPPSQAAPAR